MIAKNIINNVEQYFESVKEQFGETLFLESSKNKLKVKNKKSKKDITSQIPMQKRISADELLVVKAGELKAKLQTPNSQLSIHDNWESSKTLRELYNKIHECQKCPLGKTRTNFVFGTGNPNADIMIIGEAPGADEDEQGKPFVGKAGQLLTKILEAIKLSRDEVFIANILKCRPPNNRKPLASEENECEPYLKKQIELIKPAFILALGLTAVDCLLKKTHRMGDIRGSVMEYHGIKMLVTYHPAALLRNPNWKPAVWEDVKLLRRLYDEYLANR